MYIHIGDEICVRKDKIIGVFDLENSTVGKTTRDFFTTAEKNSEITYTSDKMPKCFVLVNDGVNTDIFLTPVSAGTVSNRLCTEENKLRGE